MDRAHDMAKVIDLKKEEYFIPQYVILRNRYVELLLTKPVTVKETEDWLKRENVEIRCLVENNVLIGTAILYLNKKGEITVFAKDKNKGIGSKLLKIIEGVAREKNLKQVWAFVLENNIIAQRVFEKNGFSKEGLIKKEYLGLIKNGFKYQKILG